MAWTDSNPHDPGVTVLELLSYSIVGMGFGALLTAAARRVTCGWRCLAMIGAVTAVHAARLFTRR